MFPLLDTLLKHVPMELGGQRHPERFMLWIDAVGGYWVCLGDEVVLGQPDSRATADVPLLGDLSCRHARICRDGEGYLIQALREVCLGGRPVADYDWLPDGSRIELGDSVRLLFRRPHALSGTARLDFASRHRTQPSSDAVLLMADTCVLGPKPDSHVVCRDWPREVILYRREGELHCRTSGNFQIDGRRCAGDGRIAKPAAKTKNQNCRVEGDGFSFNIEWLA